MQIYESCVCFVFTFNHGLQWPLKGVEGNNVLISATIRRTIGVGGLIDDDRAYILRV